MECARIYTRSSGTASLRQDGGLMACGASFVLWMKSCLRYGTTSRCTRPALVGPWAPAGERQRIPQGWNRYIGRTPPARTGRQEGVRRQCVLSSPGPDSWLSWSSRCCPSAIRRNRARWGDDRGELAPGRRRCPGPLSVHRRFEIEYAITLGGATAGKSSSGGISANLVVQTKSPIGGVRFYGIGGIGLYSETSGGGVGSGAILARNVGGGVKITLGGPFRLRLDEQDLRARKRT